QLTIREKIVLNPDDNVFLYYLNYEIQNNQVEVIAASSRIENLVHDEEVFEMVVKGPEKMKAVARVYSARKPQHASMVTADKANEIKWEWDESSNTILLHYFHDSDQEVKIQVRWEND